MEEASMDDNGKIQLNKYKYLYFYIQYCVNIGARKDLQCMWSKHNVITNIQCDTNVIKQPYDIYSMISNTYILISEGFNSKD